ncbi:putative Ataxin 2 SM domain/LsmAD domain containing protein [Leishmania utingensis]|uniref:Ataxin 2 SM domain/LsmAD domain containing protein n=1 Tax=Leishmania utingensis TaxID=653362 RepID=A0AAW3AXE6_9TRYP
MIGPNESSNADRLEYLYLNLVGQTVLIHTVDGALCEGLFVSRTDADVAADEAGVFISFPRNLPSVVHSALDASELSDETRLFRYEDIMMMEAKNMKLRTETPGAGHVHSYRGEHDLKTLDWAAEGADELLEADSHVTGQWDQFKANERFGVASTYREELYTTKLDESKLSKEQIAYAERTAKEIEGSGTRNLQHRLERTDVTTEYVDEGSMFSDVARDARGSKRNVPATRKEVAAAAPVASAVPATTAAATTATVGRGTTRQAAPAPPPPEEPVTLPPPPVPEVSAVQHKTVYSPNPSATPFVPPLKSFLANVAHLVANNDNCYACPTDWPGDIDFYDRDVSHYSRPQAPVQPNMHHKYNQPVMNPMQGRGAPMNHHQHHAMNPHPAVYNTSGSMGGHIGNPHLQQQHPQYMDPGNNNNGMMPPQGPGAMPGPSPARMQQQRTKTSQPQQPVHTATQSIPPPQQQQPHQQQQVSAIDSSGPQQDRAVSGAKKLRRGGMAAAARQDGGEGAPQGGNKKSGK